jgi:phage terminase large subunit GpA-like protein
MILETTTSEWLNLWRPPVKLPLAEWSERNIVLSPEYSARTGPLKLYGWQRGILDSFSDPTVETIVLMCSTQMVKTLFLQLALAYVICEQPAPSLLVQAKEDDVKNFSKERLDCMIRDCKVLSDKFGGSAKKDPDNTLLFKRFPNGSIALVGAGAPGNAARRSICYAFLDEIDKYVHDVGGEGDFIDLVKERTATFESRRKIILVCSPTTKDTSRIGRAYENSDQRKPWVECCHCGAWQILKWSQVRWDNSLPKEQRHLSSRYECLKCGKPWTDVERWDACERAEWRADKPFIGTAGFWISHLYRKRIAEMVKDFLAAKDSRTSLKSFVNTNLAELWEEEGEAPEWQVLKSRAENYPYGDDAVVPMRGLFLTAFVDVQADRLEYEVCAWGRNRENWSVAYGAIQSFDGNGKPLQSSNEELWLELDKVLAREWNHESGTTMPIMVMGIDTGDRPKPVYDFASRHVQPAYGVAGIKVHAPRSVCPTKGSSTETLRLLAGVSKQDAARKRQGVRIVSIGTAYAKQELFDNLRIPKPLMNMAAPGYCHHPHYGEEYFRGLCAEKRVVHDDGSVSYEKIYPRNEPLDCKVGNRAMAAVFGIDRFTDSHWQMIEKQMGITVQPVQAQLPGSQEPGGPKDFAQNMPTPPPTNDPFGRVDRGGSYFGNRKGWFR